MTRRERWCDAGRLLELGAEAVVGQGLHAAVVWWMSITSWVPSRRCDTAGADHVIGDHAACVAEDVRSPSRRCSGRTRRGASPCTSQSPTGD